MDIRAEQKKRKEMKDQLAAFTSNLMHDTGLVATNFMMKCLTGGTVVDLQLCKSVSEFARPAHCEDKTEEIAYLTMKNHISINCYKDLAAHCPELPRNHKVHNLLLWLKSQGFYR